ncbi:MAG: hypothetical protein ABIU29_00650 [Chthoniobacterales bacterium]
MTIPLHQVVRAYINASGIAGAELIASPSYPSANFGDSEVIFRIRAILVRFIRDRGQEFVDLAFNSAPSLFYQFDDVAVAMGWTTLPALLRRSEPAPIGPVVDQLANNLCLLEEAFSDAHQGSTRAKFEKAAHEREQAIMDSLRRRRGGE